LIVNVAGLLQRVPHEQALAARLTLHLGDDEASTTPRLGTALSAYDRTYTAITSHEIGLVWPHWLDDLLIRYMYRKRTQVKAMMLLAVVSVLLTLRTLKS